MRVGVKRFIKAVFMHHGVRTRRSIHVVYEYNDGCMNYNAPMVLERH